MFSRRLPAIANENALSALFGSNPGSEPDVIDLTLTNPTALALGVPRNALASALGQQPIESYAPEPLGLYTAREAVARDWYDRGRKVDPNDVMLTASTSEAYSILFKLLGDPADEILVPQPSYPLFQVLCELEGLQVRGYRLAYDGAWHIDFDSLRALVGARTRAVVVVSPNNPTGSFLKQAELEQLLELGLPLISDEVFWPYAFAPDATRVTSALSEAKTLVFALDGLSKRCGMPQLKLAWTSMSGPEALRQKARSRLELINDSYLSASTPVQLALPSLLRLGLNARQRIFERATQNLAQLAALLRGCPVNPLHVEGGWSVCLRVPATRTDESWALDLFRARRVLVQPGWFYDFDDAAHLVVSLLPEPGRFTRGIAELRGFVEASL